MAVQAGRSVVGVPYRRGLRMPEVDLDRARVVEEPDHVRATKEGPVKRDERS